MMTPSTTNTTNATNTSHPPKDRQDRAFFANAFAFQRRASDGAAHPAHPAHPAQSGAAAQRKSTGGLGGIGGMGGISGIGGIRGVGGVLNRFGRRASDATLPSSHDQVHEIHERNVVLPVRQWNSMEMPRQQQQASHPDADDRDSNGCMNEGTTISIPTFSPSQTDKPSFGTNFKRTSSSLFSSASTVASTATSASMDPTSFTKEQRAQIVNQDEELQALLTQEIAKSGVVTSAGFQEVYRKFLTSEIVTQRLEEEAMCDLDDGEDGDDVSCDGSKCTLASYFMAMPLLFKDDKDHKDTKETTAAAGKRTSNSKPLNRSSSSCSMWDEYWDDNEDSDEEKKSNIAPRKKSFLPTKEVREQLLKDMGDDYDDDDEESVDFGIGGMAGMGRGAVTGNDGNVAARIEGGHQNSQLKEDYLFCSFRDVPSLHDQSNGSLNTSLNNIMLNASYRSFMKRDEHRESNHSSRRSSVQSRRSSNLSRRSSSRRSSVLSRRESDPPLELVESQQSLVQFHDNDETLKPTEEMDEKSEKVPMDREEDGPRPRPQEQQDSSNNKARTVDKRRDTSLASSELTDFTSLFDGYLDRDDVAIIFNMGRKESEGVDNIDGDKEEEKLDGNHNDQNKRGGDDLGLTDMDLACANHDDNNDDNASSASNDDLTACTNTTNTTFGWLPWPEQKTNHANEKNTDSNPDAISDPCDPVPREAVVMEATLQEPIQVLIQDTLTLDQDDSREEGNEGNDGHDANGEDGTATICTTGTTTTDREEHHFLNWPSDEQRQRKKMERRNSVCDGEGGGASGAVNFGDCADCAGDARRSDSNSSNKGTPFGFVRR